VDEGYLSQPESIAFPTTDGKTAYMNHYPPANKDFQLPRGAAPPLLVRLLPCNVSHRISSREM